MDFRNFQEFCGECELSSDKIVIKSNILKAISFVKENYKFDILKEITAVDLEDGIELIYKLFSTENGETLLISIKVNDSIESITTLFDSAKADEREIFDLFGVNFVGHEDLKRLYMPKDWKGHPLKKDYVNDDERLNWNE